MDLDPDKVTNNMDEMTVQAEILKGFQGTLTQGPQQFHLKDNHQRNRS